MFERFVRRILQRVGLRAEALTDGAHEPVVVFLGVVAVASALNQRDAADLVARSFARRNPAHFLEARLTLFVETEEERDADGGLAACDVLGLRLRALGVLRDVFVHLLHVVEGLVFAHQLNETCDDGVRAAGRTGVRHFDVAFVLRVRQISPAFGRRQF